MAIQAQKSWAKEKLECGGFRGRGRGGSLEPCLLLAVLHVFLVPCTLHVPVGEHVAGCMCTRVIMSVCVCSYAKGDGNSTVCAAVPRGTCVCILCPPRHACLHVHMDAVAS